MSTGKQARIIYRLNWHGNEELILQALKPGGKQFRSDMGFVRIDDANVCKALTRRIISLMLQGYQITCGVENEDGKPSDRKCKFCYSLNYDGRELLDIAVSTPHSRRKWKDVGGYADAKDADDCKILVRRWVNFLLRGYEMKFSCNFP